MDRFDRPRWQRGMRMRGSGLVGGIILAGIGVLLLLQNLGIPMFDDLERFWPVILIIVGITHAARSWGMGGRVWGGLVFGVGVIFLLSNFNVIHGDLWRFVWPGVLILVGLGMLAKNLDRNAGVGQGPSGVGAAGTRMTDQLRERMMGTSATAGSLDHLNEWAFFSGVRRRIDSQNFQGGDAFAMFGGVEIDMRKAASTQPQILIEANAMFGGVELRVPENWNVTVRGSGIFGGYEDKTMDARVAVDATQPHLIVNGFAIFGGVTIQN